MIYLIHQNNRVLKILNNEKKEVVFNKEKSIAKTLFYLAKTHPDELIIWCHNNYFDYLNIKELPNVFHHKRVLASFNVAENNYLPNQIGYVDLSIYIKINKKISYATWLMSSDVGGIYAEVLNTILYNLKRHSNFNYFLNSVAKTAMQQGLFCYSNPNLLLDKPNAINEIKQASTFTLFQFVKQQYKWRWIYILFLSYIIYEKKFPLFPLLRSLFYRKNKYDFDFTNIPLQSSRKIINKKEVDVVIPTIGRKNYLYDVLKDLSVQTLLPKNVIIVEQNPIEDSVSELDYIKNEKWSFNIKHKFIHQTGVCNARNIALNLVESEWTLLGDDDNRFEPNLIECFFIETEKTGANVGTSVYLKPDEKQTYFKTTQTSIFAGGNSFLKSELTKKVKFNLNFEHNYGEDHEFGMQLRHLGEDIIFYPNIKIKHLKAPFGGFRTNFVHPWGNEETPPKPSPTLMLLYLKNFTKQQLQCYKLLLFIRFYKNQPIKNPFRYISEMKKRWQVSLTWANKLDDNA
ncbi:glycosyltransferase family 2 protein [Sabulilitoribacter arenilitoris]|uniref:Glycosyltransferase family 2 protein n=1 Tax=Wocania arenilitoris TaxID=2044858 RepID=A0AAE3JNS3_9FLAO|nr:glycosyltransferase family A protein [Wocania arenilitoris]MCF7568971.1 glycosyltransferase family 2 protein [Wocania arenilitoris]